jgi:hypothetical protein
MKHPLQALVAGLNLHQLSKSRFQNKCGPPLGHNLTRYDPLAGDHVITRDLASRRFDHGLSLGPLVSRVILIPIKKGVIGIQMTSHLATRIRAMGFSHLNVPITPLNR